jgi:hypothetical protein
MLNYSNQLLLKQIVEEIKNSENMEQKEVSLAEWEIYSDRILPHVKAYLSGFYSSDSLNEIPIIACINLAKRIVDKEAEIYTYPVQRTFKGLTDAQVMLMEQIYKDMNINNVMLVANKRYRLQNLQTTLQVSLINKKLKAKVLMRHQVDVVPSPLDSELADAYLVSGFNKAYSGTSKEETDNQNQLIADPDDYKAGEKAISLWSDQFNFVIDENGNIISGNDTINPIQMIPFVDVASSKDGEYWREGGASLTDFTIQFNAAYSDLSNIVRMQGFAQAFLVTAEDGNAPKNFQIGPNQILHLKVNPENPIQPQFNYVNPNPDLDGSIKFIESLLSSFLTSRGVNPKTVNTKGEAESYSSGIERLLAQIDSFKPSQQDFDVFKEAEKKLFKIIIRYLNTYQGSDLLEYNLGNINEQAADVDVIYASPTVVKSEKERLDEIMQLVEMGVITEVDKIAMARQVDHETAEEILEEIKQEMTEQESDAEVENEEEPLLG